MTLFDDLETVKAPDIALGKTHKGCGYTKSAPREWTQEEIEYCQGLRSQGFSNEAIGELVGRTAVSVQIKLKRLGKADESYNEHHRAQKYASNMEFAEEIQPRDILDLYCGTESWWRKQDKWTTITNDIDKKVDADFHEDAAMLLHFLYYHGNDFDLIDLDPYGSAYECFDLAIKMANKGLIITFGEIGHKRWKRLDFVKRYYGIESLEDFTLQNLIAEVEKIARRNKKHLEPIICDSYDRIARVYFKVMPIKITEQWNHK